MPVASLQSAQALESWRFFISALKDKGLGYASGNRSRGFLSPWLWGELSLLQKQGQSHAVACFPWCHALCLTLCRHWLSHPAVMWQTPSWRLPEENTDASLLRRAACTVRAMCWCLHWIYRRCWSRCLLAISTPCHIRVVPYWRLAHLEINQILYFLTTFSGISLLNHSTVSIIINSSVAEIPICIYYPLWGVLKMHHGPPLPFPGAHASMFWEFVKQAKTTRFLSS